MSDGEVFFFILSAVAMTASWGALISQASNLPSYLAKRRTLRILVVGPAVAMLGLAVVLRSLASFDVRDSVTYLVFYLVLGGGWIGVGRFLPLGLSLRDDVIERDNVAAAIGWAGSCIGLMACYAGANIGDGPSFTCVLEAGFLATLGLFASTAAVDHFARLPERVTIDRDLAAGIRLASFFVVGGILWGRGAAGDYESFGQTVLDMVAAWPAVVLVLKVIAVESMVRPTPTNPSGDVLLHGVAPAMVDVMLLVAGLVLAGPLPDGYPSTTAVFAP